MFANVINPNYALVAAVLPWGMTRPQLYPLKSHYAQIQGFPEKEHPEIDQILHSSVALPIHADSADVPCNNVTLLA